MAEPVDGDRGLGKSFFPPLQPDWVLHVCLICGAVVPAKGIGFHDDWHTNISRAAIDALSRDSR